jgi:hypothetical protein
MKKILLIVLIGGFIANSASAQTEKPKKDSVVISVITITYKKDTSTAHKNQLAIKIGGEKKQEKKKITTNWWVLDLGFANYTDKSDYQYAEAQGFVNSSIGAEQFKLKTGHSINVNLWIITQKLNLYKQAWNLKYAVGLETNNYQFQDERMYLTKLPTKFQLAASPYHKTKLAADYLTVPVMLNYNTTPGKNKGLNLSAGISAGFLYSSRFKIKSSGIDKTHGDFGLEKFKLAYVGEIGIKKVKLYGSFAMKNMWSNNLNATPFSVGFRLGNW